METVWQLRMRTVVKRYAALATARAAEARAGVECGGSARWYQCRARAIAEPRGARVASCGTATQHVRCGCRVRELLVGCGQVLLCPRCARRYYGRLRSSLAEALSARASGRQRAYLVTLTVPHSGDVGADRRRLAELWAKLGREARRHAWWGHYAAVYEVTAGTDGRGHVHMHAVVLSAWVPYKEVHRHWRRMLGQSSYHLHFRYRHGVEVAVAARYLAKYASKGVQASEFSGKLAGEVCAAWYGRRKVTASRGLWLEREHVCGTCCEAYRVRPKLPRRVPSLGVLYREAELRGAHWVRYGPAQDVLAIVR